MVDTLHIAQNSTSALAVKTRLKHAGLSRDVSLKQILVGRHSN